MNNLEATLIAFIECVRSKKEQASPEGTFEYKKTKIDLH